MAFKKAPKTSEEVSEINKELRDEIFISKARGESSEIKQAMKYLNVPVPMETFNKLKSYQMTEGKKIETQSYIVNEALNDWFVKKGYQQ